MSSQMRAGAALTVAALLLTGMSGCGDSSSQPAGAPPQDPGTTEAAAQDPSTPSARTERTHSARPDGVTPRPSPSAALATLPIDRGAAVSLYAPGYDAPGSLIQVVATVEGAGPDDRLDARIAVDGGTAECGGSNWRHSKGLSQACWAVLPQKAGTHLLRTTAVLTSPTGDARRTTAETAKVQAKGVATTPVPPSRRDEITRCGNTTDNVWLTFDDGFISETTMRKVLGVLERENVRGRFFATGAWARSHPKMLASLRSAGHVIGNHTKNHEPLSGLNDAALREEIAGGAEADEPRLMRPGYGAGAYASRVDRAAAAQGLGACYWTVDPRDWAGPTAAQIISRVMKGDWRTPVKSRVVV